MGRYILQPSIFHMLENTQPDINGEIQLTDGIAQLLKKEDVYGYHIKGKRYDCGSKLGYLQATFQYALQHPELADDFRAYLKEQWHVLEEAPEE